MAQKNSDIRKDAFTFLKNNTAAVIATSIDDTPSAATVYYIVDDQLNFYFVTKRGTGKYLNLAINPKVAIVVGVGPRPITVQASGKAKILYKKEKEKTIDLIIKMQKKRGIEIWPIQELEEFKEMNSIRSSYVVFKVKPRRLNFLNLDAEQFPKSVSSTINKIL